MCCFLVVFLVLGCLMCSCIIFCDAIFYSTDTITAGGCSRGICQRPANSLGGGSTDCLEDDECQSPHVCIGNNGGVCAGGDCEYGICQRPHHSLSGGATCLKDNECRSPATCIGNNGGVVVPGSQPIEGVCQHTDNSLNHGSNCLKNDECQHICDGHDSDCDGVCIGTSREVVFVFLLFFAVFFLAWWNLCFIYSISSQEIPVVSAFLVHVT